MSKKRASEEEIVGYLLGALPEAETERLDELTVTDPEFADAVSAAEHDLVDAYARSELTGNTLQQFKTHYLTSFRGREKLDFAQGLADWAEKYSAAQSANDRRQTAVASSKTEKILSRFSALFRIPPLTSPWGFAVAGFALLLATSWLVFEIAKPASAGRIAFFTLKPPMRSAAQTPTLSIPAKTKNVAMELELEPNEYSDYVVTLTDQSGGAERWRSELLKPTGKGDQKVVNVRLTARLLKSQNYSLVVSGINADGSAEIIGSYPFRAEVR